MSKTEINPNLIIVGGILLFGMTAGKKILEALGLSDSKSDIEETKSLQAMQADNYFDPDYFKKGGAGTLLLTVAAAQAYAKILYDAKQIINDDEAAVYGVFQALKTKSQISFLAGIFFNVYKKSLLGYLSSFLNQSELANVSNICNKLPAFKV